MNTINRSEVAKRLRRLKSDHGISQEAIAQVCGLTQQTVSTWMNEKDVAMPGIAAIYGRVAEDAACAPVSGRGRARRPRN